MKSTPLLILSCSLLLFVSCGGKDTTIADFEQQLETAKQSEFVEEGTTLDTLTTTELTDLDAAGEEQTGDTSLIDSLRSLTGDAGAQPVSRLEVARQLTANIEQAKRQGQTDPELARITLSHIRETMDYLERTSSGDGLLPEVSESVEVVRAEALALQRTLDNVITVDQPVLVADLTDKIKESIEGGTWYNGRWYLHTARAIITSPDPAFGTIERHDLAPDLRITGSSPFPYNNTIAFSLQPNKIAEFGNGAVQIIELADAKVAGIAQPLTYSNRRFMYLLDPGNNQVWKYSRGGTTYQSPTSALQKDAQLSDAVSIAIDGNIYTLRSTGEIARYYDGQLRPEFVVHNTPSNYRMPTDPKSTLFTREGMKHVYVLNHGLKTVFVYEKNTPSNTRALTYVRQFGFTDEIIDMAVTDNEQELLLITPKKILKVAL